MKKILLFLLIVNSVVLYSQNGPAMNWQKVTMTGWDDRLTNIIQTSDGGYITLGQSNTAPGYTFDCPISKSIPTAILSGVKPWEDQEMTTEKR